MADLAITHEETPSVLDDVEVGHLSKSIKLGSEGEGLLHGSPSCEITPLQQKVP